MISEVEKKHIFELIDYAVKVEKLVSDMYLLFSELFEINRDFWWKMGQEEMNHASIIESAKIFLRANILPYDALFDDLDSMKNTISQLETQLAKWHENTPDENECVKFALELEKSGQEFYFDSIVHHHKANNKIHEIFQKLSKDEESHIVKMNNLLK